MFKFVSIAAVSAIALMTLSANAAEAPKKAKVALSEKQMDGVTAGWNGFSAGFVNSIVAAGGTLNSSSSFSP